MGNKNTLSKIYPIVFIVCPHFLMIMIVSLSRLKWTELKTLSAIGIICGIVAEVLIIKNKISFGPYLKKIILTTLGSIAFWIAYLIFEECCLDKMLDWGWWLKDWAIALKNAITFAPAVVTTVFWCIDLRKSLDKAIAVILINPVFHLALIEYVISAFASALPT